MNYILSKIKEHEMNFLTGSFNRTCSSKNSSLISDRTTWTMWVIYTCALEVVAIVTGNLAVMIVFTRTPSLRMRKYCLLVSLAAADFFVGLISVPYYLSLCVISVHLDAVHLVYRVQDILFGTASAFGLAAVAIERAYAVYFPIKHRTLGEGVYRIGMASVWFAAIFFTLIAFLGKSNFIIAVAIILVSLLSIIISYVLIWIKLYCMTNMSSHAIRRRDKKMTVTLLIVTIVSLLAWIPFQVVSIYGIKCGAPCLHDKGREVMITKVLQYGNSLVNPIIYALRVPQFRRALVKRFPCNRQPRVRVDFEQAAPHRVPSRVGSVVPINSNDTSMTKKAQGGT